MSRYIDAERLVAWCNTTFQAQSTVSGKAYVNDFLAAVLSCLVEDVAPISDTVRKMQERLQAYFGTYVLGYKIPLTEALKAVNQIAKEMLEDEI